MQLAMVDRRAAQALRGNGETGPFAIHDLYFFRPLEVHDEQARAVRVRPLVSRWAHCNTHNMLDPNMPFGGFKQSGVGREHGRAVLDLYLEKKSVCIAY